MAYIESRPLRAGSFDPGVLLLALASVCAVTLGVLLGAGALPALAIVGMACTLVLATVRPRAGLSIVTFAAIGIDGSTPFVNGGWLYRSLADYGVGLSPLELILACSVLGLLIRLVFDDTVQLRTGALFLSISILIATVALGIGLGIARGADMSVLRSETRAMFYLPALSLLATHFIRTRADMRRLLWIFVVAVNVMAAVSIYRYYHDVRGNISIASPDLVFAHENALFCAAGIILLLARIVWSRNVLHEWKSVLLMALPMIALLVMRRRAGMVALDAALILLCVVLLRDNFRLFLMVVPLAIVGVGLLLALTWNQPGGLGQPARSFRTITGSQDSLSGRDQASDDYRTREELNVRINVHNEPVTGLGFGRPYAFYVPLADLSFWPLWHYVPHNTVFWLWMKAGALAFVALLALFGSAVFRSMQLMASMRADTMKPVAFALGAMVVMFAMYSYVDLGLVTPRAMMFFGAVLGGIGALGPVTQPRHLGPATPRPREVIRP